MEESPVKSETAVSGGHEGVQFVIPAVATRTVVEVKNISWSTTVQQLKDFFSFCGEIKQFQLTNTSVTPLLLLFSFFVLS